MVILLEPTARLNNGTEDVMVVVTEDALGFVLSLKRIESGGFVDLGYRKGIDRIGPQIKFWVYPENRRDLRGSIFPSQVFEFAEIDISYKLPDPDGSVTRNYQVGAVLHFHFRSDTMFRRIGLVRCFTALYDYVTTAFGNCCFAAHVPNPGEAADHISAPIQAPPALGVAAVPASDPPLPLGSEAPGSDPIQAPDHLALGEALGLAPPALAFYSTEALAPTPAMHVGIDIPFAAQVAAPIPPPAEIQLVN